MTAISVIIPTLRDDKNLRRLIERLATMNIADILICDAENRPSLPQDIRSQSDNIRHISCEQGRGPQIKCGLDIAAFEHIWVLHADSLPHPDSAEAIKTLLMDRLNSLVTFTLTFDKSHPLLSLYAWFARWDSRVSTFGDQGFAFRLSDYRALGLELDKYPLLEDVVLRKALKKKGRILRSPLSIQTSSRRFAKYGMLKTQLLNLSLLMRYFCGVSPDALYQRYYPTSASHK